MNVDVDDEVALLAGWLYGRPADAGVEAFTAGAVWALAAMSGRPIEDVRADLDRAVTGHAAAAAEAAAPGVSRDELIAKAAAAGSPRESFGPAHLGLRVVRHARRPTRVRPSPSMMDASAAASADPAFGPMTAEEIAEAEAAMRQPFGVLDH